MQNPKAILLFVYLIVGTAMVALSIPLIRGRVGPNSWYGFRVKRTLDNPAIWYPANRYAACHLLALGIAIVVTAILLCLLPQITFVPYALSMLAVTMIGLAVSMIRSFKNLHALSSPPDRKC
jgi:uncharacterized membrane protein